MGNRAPIQYDEEKAAGKAEAEALPKLKIHQKRQITTQWDEEKAAGKAEAAAKAKAKVEAAKAKAEAAAKAKVEAALRIIKARIAEAAAKAKADAAAKKEEAAKAKVEAAKAKADNGDRKPMRGQEEHQHRQITTQWEEEKAAGKAEADNGDRKSGGGDDNYVTAIQTRYDAAFDADDFDKLPALERELASAKALATRRAHAITARDENVAKLTRGKDKAKAAKDWAKAKRLKAEADAWAALGPDAAAARLDAAKYGASWTSTGSSDFKRGFGWRKYRCNGTTQYDIPCRQRVVEKRGYCRYHANQA